MSEELSGNVLIIQCGEPTLVSNTVLAGAITESLNHDVIVEVYGVVGGFQGILKEDFIDLAEESQQVVRGLRHTPGSALGGTQALEGDEEIQRALRVLEAHDVRFLIVIGDVAAMQSAQEIKKAAAASEYSIRINVVPQGTMNSIPVTDHCLGYGSNIKYISAVTKAFAVECAPEGNHDIVCILEINGGNTGWLTAGASLAKHRNRPEDAPHLLCLPEAKFEATKFLEEIRATLKHQRICVIATNATLFDSEGNYLGSDNSTQQSVSAGDYLAGLVEEHLGLKVKLLRLDDTYRMASWLTSKTDTDEAFACGEASIRDAVAGKSGFAISIQRAEGDTYEFKTGLISIDEACGASRVFPQDWVHENELTLKHQYYKYASAFIQGEVTLPYDGGLPFFARLNKRKIERKLEVYAAAT